MEHENWQKRYAEICTNTHIESHKPIIGIIGDNATHIVAKCTQTNGVPFVIAEEACLTPSVLDAIDGLSIGTLQRDWQKVFVQSAQDRQIPIYQETQENTWTSFLLDALEYRKACTLHQRILTLDTHCDTPMFFDQDINFGCRDERILMDAHKMREGHLDACIMVAYLEQGQRDDETLKATTRKCDALLEGIDKRIISCEGVGLACSPHDLYQQKIAGNLAIMKGIENGYAIGKDISNIERYKKQGVVYMTLCHNGDNDICDSAVRTNNEHNGLSEFGRQVVAEMNRVGMMVDLSHAGERSFYDALECSKTPIVCSHASTKALCNHPRNLSDDQLRALSKAGGVMQVTLYPGFLRTDGKATIEDAVAHLMHAIDVAGIDAVGIGTDFDGDGGVPGMADASQVINFTRRLLRKRFSERDIQKIWGENFLRVMRQVQNAGCIK